MTKCVNAANINGYMGVVMMMMMMMMMKRLIIFPISSVKL